jgi:hypothetical protein
MARYQVIQETPKFTRRGWVEKVADQEDTYLIQLDPIPYNDWSTRVRVLLTSSDAKRFGIRTARDLHNKPITAAVIPWEEQNPPEVIDYRHGPATW